MATPLNIGEEFIGTNPLTGSGGNAVGERDVADLGNGTFVEAYHLGTNSTPHIQLFTDAGIAIGDSILLNNAPATGITVARLTNGRFLVVWNDTDDAGNPVGQLHGQLFNLDGSTFGSVFNASIPEGSNGAELHASITALANGAFAISYTDDSEYDDIGPHGEFINHDIGLLFFDANGVGGSEIIPHADRERNQTGAATTTLSDGRVVVVWSHFYNIGGPLKVTLHAAIYTADGGVSVPEFDLLSDYTPSLPGQASVAALANKQFVVTWQEHADIYARIVDEHGGYITPEFTVNSTTPNTQSVPMVATLTNGEFVVVWQSVDTSPTNTIRGQLFQADGSTDGSEFIVGSGSGINSPSVAALPDSKFAVSWNGADGQLHTQIFAGFHSDGTTGDDTPISGTPGKDILAGLAGNDIIWGLDGNDTLDGGQDNDTLLGGAGNNILYGDAGNDTLDITLGGTDTAMGGAGEDTIVASTALTKGDIVDGGDGFDTLLLDGDYNLTLGPTTVKNVEDIQLHDGHKYTFVAGDANVAAGAAMIVDGSNLSSNRLIYNAAAETDGFYDLRGGTAADRFTFNGASFGSGDSANGGAGSALDSLTFSGAVNLTAAALAHVSHIEALELTDGTNSIAIPDAVAGSSDANQRLIVIGNAGDDTIDGSAVTTATNRLLIVAGAGNDTLTGGAGADTFGFKTADFNAADTVNGGTGSATDTLAFSTSGPIAASAFAGVSHIERLTFTKAVSHNVTLSDALVASADDNHLLTLIGNSDIDIFNASLVQAGHNVRFVGGLGADRLTGGGGTDTFAYDGAADSRGDANGTLYDTIVHFDTAADRIDLPNADKPTSIVTVASGTLDNGTGVFDSELASTIGSALGAHTAVELTVTAGNLAGHHFLVVNPTATAGYVSGTDYVFDVTGHTGSFTTGDFV